MGKLNLSPWLSRLLSLGTLTAAVTVIAWGGPKLKIWNYLSKTTPPASSSSISGTIANQEKPGLDKDCTSGIAATNLIETTPQTDLTTLTSGDSYREYEIQKREALIRELESRICISTSNTALIEPEWNFRRWIGFSAEDISEDPLFESFPREEAIRNVHREQIRVLRNQIIEYLITPREPTEEEKQQQNNEILLQRILRRDGRIREINFLITKSHAITANREAEWEAILNATARRARGLRKQIIMSDPAFKKLESDKVQVLSGEQASRTKHRAKVRVLRIRNDKDKNNIINIGAPAKPEETSLPRE